MKTCLTLCLLLPVLCASAQYRLMGDAAYMKNECIQLTEDKPYSEGIAYNMSKLNLTNPFEIEFDLYLGNKDSLGADGITFVIHNDERGFNAYGTYGECMGYGRWRIDMGGNFIAPSVAVEFDTYYNEAQNDPLCDHVAFLTNGTNYHTRYWNDDTEDYNLEDDYLHNFRFSWNPKTQTVIVFLDNRQAYQGKINLIDDIFEGNTSVIWGFTASTGKKYNLQFFCLKRFASVSDHKNDKRY